MMIMIDTQERYIYIYIYIIIIYFRVSVCLIIVSIRYYTVIVVADTKRISRESKRY